MSSIQNQSSEDVEVGTILSTDVEFDGLMTFNKPVIIQGTVRGNVESSNDVFIATEAIVTADVMARRISIKGTVEGTLKARERLELFRSARVSGTVDTVDLVIQSGALLNGTCRMSTVPPVADVPEEEAQDVRR